MTKSCKRLPRLAAILGLAIGMAILLSSLTAAASPVLALRPSDGELDGTASKNGPKIGNVGKNGGSVEGTVTFRELDLPADGYYTLVITYYSGSDDRYFNLTADGGTVKVPCPSTGGFDKKGTVSLDVRLTKGGTLTVGSDWYGPDFGGIEIFEPEREEVSARAYENRREESFTHGGLTLTLDAANGIWSFASDGTAVVTDARAECAVGGGTVASDGFARHRISADGDSVVFTHEGHPDFPGTMIQTFVFGNGALFTEAAVSADGGVSTGRIVPLAADRIGAGDGAFLTVPFDNDMWAEPALTEIGRISGTAVSYEVGALLDADGTAGTVFGSVEHDTWKTGVILDARLGEVTGFSVAGGFADSGTRDVEPHGTVSGDAVKSPRIFVGRFADWRDGMTAFAEACAETVPPVGSVPDVPFGYNSWGVLQAGVSFGAMTAVSDYVRDRLADVWGADGAPVYVNIDSFWDYIAANDPDCGLTLDEALRAFVKHCRDNGQKAGIYFTPFAAWQGDEDALKRSRIEGTPYTCYDAALKRADGTLYGKLDGGYALDPTHPGTIRRMEDKLLYFIELGFEYVKLDFMAHGACEGAHYDPAVTTGIRAYSEGMARIREICAGKMFVNLSIAPIFPYQYADGRRISCDAFSSLDNTRHVLSCLTGCFWEKTLYPYPDPDHLVVWGRDGGVGEGEARCRVTSGAIAGTSFLAGDDLSDVEEGSAKDVRITSMLANPDVVAVAKLGKSFRPWRAVPGERCADVFFLQNGEERIFALFNFGGEAREFTVPPETDGAVRVRELWRGTEWEASDGVLTVTVPAGDAALCRITPLSSSADPGMGGAAGPERAEGDSGTEAAGENPGMIPAEESPKKADGRGVTASVLGILGCLAAAALAAAVILKKRRSGKR